MSTRNYHSDCHRKYILQAHVILSCKYRKKLLIKLGDIVKQIIMNVADTHGFKICTMEVDKDHIHILLDLTPSQLPSNIVKIIKSITTVELWDKHPKILKSKFSSFPDLINAFTSFGKQLPP